MKDFLLYRYTLSANQPTKMLFMYEIMCFRAEEFHGNFQKVFIFSCKIL